MATKHTVMVIDDEELVLQVACEILDYLGYSVVTSTSGEDAIRRLSTGPQPDLVILDVIMPGLNGVETFRKIREAHPSLPVLISSGYAERASFQALGEQGVDGFVNKPYHIETLAKEIRKHLG